MLSAVLLGSISSCLKKEKRRSLKLWKHYSLAIISLRERERERERERKRERQRERDRDRDRETETERDRDREGVMAGWLAALL